MQKIFYGILIIFSVLSANAELFNLDQSGRTLFNGEKSLVIDDSNLKVRFSDESWSTDTDDFNQETKVITIRAKKVVLLVYSSGVDLNSERKSKIIANSLSECRNIKSIIQAEESTKINEPTMKIVSVEYSIPEPSINTRNPDRVTMRCHVDVVVEFDRK